MFQSKWLRDSGFTSSQTRMCSGTSFMLSGPPLDATYMLVIIFKLSLIHVFGKHGSVGVGPSARVPPSARVTSPRSRRCPAQRLKHCSWISQLLTQHEPSEDFHRSISFCGSHDLTPTLYSWSCSQLLIIKERYSSSSCTRTCAGSFAEQGLWGHDDSRANSAWGLTVFLLRWSHASKWGWSNCFCALQTHRSCLTNYHRCLSNCREV